MIADLAQAGWTQAQIALALGGRPQSWVADIARGRYKDLKWRDGELLRALHIRVTKKEPHMPNTPDPKPDDRIPIGPPGCITKGGAHA